MTRRSASTPTSGLPSVVPSVSGWRERFCVVMTGPGSWRRHAILGAAELTVFINAWFTTLGAAPPVASAGAALLLRRRPRVVQTLQVHQVHHQVLISGGHYAAP